MNKKQTKLSVKQALFVKKYTDASNPKTFLNTMQSFKAMTGKDGRYERVGGYLMQRKPHVKAAILEALHKVKITPQFQAQKLKNLMEANKSVYHNGMKVATEEDNEIRHKALVTSLKITDAIDNLENKLSEGGVNINISPEMMDRLLNVAKEMKEMREAHSQQAIPLIQLKEADNG